ncbi:hypothetical protein [Geobacter sp.]|uniref:hypothetical protein n=1 Tax=Geobacter sp. TaxID=46610 RepID=UPI002606FF77|nr:hypothetical protein [Geobacter sp.]
MPTPAFPALSVVPAVSAWKEKKALDPTLRTQTEGGYVQTRPRFTRIPKRWEIAYKAGNALPAADKATLEAFETTVKVGSNMFTWLNPLDNVTYNVRLREPIEFAPEGTTLLWQARLILEQV